VEPIGRCRATEANPDTGRRDANTLAALEDGWGHTRFGVYAMVRKGGRVAVGDRRAGMTALPFPLAEAPDETRPRAGRLLFARGADFLKGVVAMDGMPPADRAEVCFAGRSNVGKSTLINALTGRKALARASNTPGRTQEINFFTLGESHYLVDLPGYGYAEAPGRRRAEMAGASQGLSAGRATLRRAFVLIDARHGIKPVDEEIMALLDTAAVTFQVVLTKADKVKEKDRERVLAQVRKRSPPIPPPSPSLCSPRRRPATAYPHCARSSPISPDTPSSFPEYARRRFTVARGSPIPDGQTRMRR
jgi:GTP-binding protein